MSHRMTAEQLKAFRKSEGDTRPHTDREGPIHKAVLRLLELALPRDAIFHHSPNELDMSGPQAARLVAKARDMGTRAGWPDFEIIHQGKFYALEVKALTSQSPEQKQVQAEIFRAGGHYAVVRSVTEAQYVLQEWGLT